MQFKKTTLPNGVRVIMVPTKGNPSVTVLVATETGSNYERKQDNGISHFLEHMCFKGTKSRIAALDIVREIETLGADNNAFTANEVTAYHAKGQLAHAEKMLDIVSDVYLNPTFPENDLEKEKGVILQEISMYEDVPRAKVWHVLIDLMYGDQPAGRPVIGPPENVKKFTRKDFIKYHRDHYIAEKTIVVIAGDLTEAKALSLAKKYFKDIPKGEKPQKFPVKEAQKHPQMKVLKRKSDQTHIIMAFRSMDAKDKRLPALYLLSTILGQGMSSRLFHKLREEMGACYYVRTVTEEFTDHGLLSVNVGIGADTLSEVVKAVLEECRILSETPVHDEELSKAKEYYLGHLFMNLETTDSLAEFYLDQEVSSHELKDPKEIEKEIRAVTAEEVMQVAQDIFRDDNLNLAIVGNVKNPEPIRKLLKF